MNNFRLVLSALTLALLFCFDGILIGQTTWVGGADTNWNTAANWDSGAVPNLTSSEAIVGAPSPTEVTSSLNIASLTVLPDGFLTVGPSVNLDFSAVAEATLGNAGMITVLNGSDFQLQETTSNSGEIIVNSTGSITDLEVDGLGALISGGGTITLSGSSNARIQGATSSLMVSSQTIQGQGQIGANSIAITFDESALVDANSSGNMLTVDGSAAVSGTRFGTINNGILRASSGGILRLQSDAVDNTNGVIEALDGSTVNLNSNSTVVGGTIRSFGSGQVTANESQNIFLEDLTLEADVQTGNGSDFGLTGLITNRDTISVNSTGSITDVEIQAEGATLAGSGSIVLTGSNNARVQGSGLLILQDQTISGRGQVGSNSIAIQVEADSVIEANSAGNPLTIEGNSSFSDDEFGTVNNGTMRASNGGVLQLQSDIFDNTNGVIEALPGSEVSLGLNASVVGGLIRSVGSGQITGGASQNIFLEDVTLDADLQTANGSDLGLSGTINNQGLITAASTGSITDIEIQQTGAVLTGGGTINLTGSNNARINGINGVLTIDNQTIQGRGQVGANSIATILNSDALIDANSNGNTLAIDGSSTISSSEFGTVNNGVMRASNGGILQLGNDSFDNTNGVVEALADSTVNLTANSTIVGGTLRSVGNGLVVASASQNVFLENLTLDANVQTLNGSDFGLTGAINNLGEVLVDSTGNITDIEIQSAGATISGDGTITLSGTNARINGFAPFSFDDGTLTGNGSVNVDSSFANATISPGLAVGSLRFLNVDTALTEGTTIRHEIQSTVVSPGISADVIDVTGQLDLDGVTIGLVSLDASGGMGAISDFDPDESFKFTVAVANSIGDFEETVVDTTDFANSFDGEFSVTISPQGSRQALIVRYGEFALGDVNQDGTVNLLDVRPFLDAISNNSFIEEADVNCDGAVNLLDVCVFVDIVSG